MLFKKFFAIFIAAAILALSSCGTASDMGERTTMEFVKDMGMGINLGNTFDCSGDWFEKNVEAQETAWGSPVITKKMIKGYADGGFGVMRLPVSWTVLMDDEGNIDKDFMNSPPLFCPNPPPPSQKILFKKTVDKPPAIYYNRFTVI